MAKQEHLDLLKQGSTIWNQWKNQNPQEIPDLTGADLSDLDLRLVNLYRGKLTKTNLRGSDLRWANLFKADLSHADLTGAILIRTDLNCADLSFANLSLTQLGETVFANTQLTGSRGLASCNHVYPSIVDHRTLSKSRFIPLDFLRGCGLPESLIEYLPSLLGRSDQFYSCFISYNSLDQEFAVRIYEDLQNTGVRCWFAPQDWKLGVELRSQLHNVIGGFDKILLILSENSVNNQWVESEIKAVLKQENETARPVLFPISIDDIVYEDKGLAVASLLENRFIADFKKWKQNDEYRRAFSRLLRDLEASSDTVLE